MTYAALTALGPSFRIETDVLGAGQQVDQTWQGDLVLKGYGDPTLTPVSLRVLARQVRAAGIVRVTGRVLADESWFDARRTAPGWKTSFYIEESPPLSALIVDRGRVGRFTTLRSQPGSSSVRRSCAPGFGSPAARHTASRTTPPCRSQRSTHRRWARSCAGWIA